MAIAIRDLLLSIGAELDSENPPAMPEGALQWIGRLSLSPRLMVDDGIFEGWNIWTSGPGWIPLENLDIERWMVDVNDEKHLVVCERESMGLISIDDDIGGSIMLWNPEKYAAFVGRAVLSGKLSIKPDEAFPDYDLVEPNQEVSEEKMPMPPAGIDLALAPLVDVQNLMQDRGRSGISLRPVMIEAALWVVDSNLVGPNKESESNRWWIIEDPLSGDCEISGEVEFLRQAPNVEILDSNELLDETRIRSRLSKILDVRRAEELTSTDSGVSTSGGLLRWWRVNFEDAILNRRKLLLPAWIGNMPVDGIRVVHGLTGVEHELNPT